MKKILVIGLALIVGIVTSTYSIQPNTTFDHYLKESTAPLAEKEVITNGKPGIIPTIMVVSATLLASTYVTVTFGPKKPKPTNPKVFASVEEIQKMKMANLD